MPVSTVDISYDTLKYNVDFIVAVWRFKHELEWMRKITGVKVYLVRDMGDTFKFDDIQGDATAIISLILKKNKNSGRYYLCI